LLGPEETGKWLDLVASDLAYPNQMLFRHKTHHEDMINTTGLIGMSARVSITSVALPADEFERVSST